MTEASISLSVDDESEGTALVADEEQEHQRFGPHVKKLREIRRLTQDELAELAGLAGDTIRRLEHNEFSPSLRTIRKVTRALGISLTSLFGAFESTEFEIAREFIDLLLTRSDREHIAFAGLWRSLAAELDALERGEPFFGNLAPDKKPTQSIFGRHVRSLRRARGMTQEVLAEHCGISGDTIRRIELGTMSPGLDTLTKLCNGLGMMRSTLFQSLEEERNVDREIADLLYLRSPAERELGLRMLRALFETINAVGRAV